MDTVEQLYCEVRESFPEISAQADQHYRKYWDEAPTLQGAYSWFQSLANALNAEMKRQVGYPAHAGLFAFMEGALGDGSEAVHNCIDVSFVENLFWQVSPPLAESYWHPMPERLKALYVGFHGKPPL